MAQPANENKMGIMPENKLLLNMALPMILSMLIQACYNIVDSYFVSKLSQDALNAVGLAFPVQNLMIAVSVGTGVGINALLSRSLGQKDQERANRTHPAAQKQKPHAQLSAFETLGDIKRIGDHGQGL